MSQIDLSAIHKSLTLARPHDKVSRQSGSVTGPMYHAVVQNIEGALP
jgi:hypothetical protein